MAQLKCDKCGLAERCKGELFCRRCYVRLFGHEPESKGSRLKYVAMAPLVAMAGCASSLASQVKPSGTRFSVANDAPCGQTWWQQIAGLGVLNWMGGLLILAGGVAFVGAFVPAVGALFPKKMAVSCVIAGVASILLYNFLTEYLWAVYLTLAAGGLLALLAYRHWLWEKLVGVAEMVVQRDLDKSGGIGPNEE